MTNDEYKELLHRELDKLKRQKVIRRYDTTYNSFTGKFDIWVEWFDKHATNFHGILTADDLAKEFSKSLPVKKSYKCSLCKNYVPDCDGCRYGYFNSLFIPCPDFKESEFAPSDMDMCEALTRLKEQCKNMIEPDVEIHKKADELLCYILNRKGYNKGVKKYNDIPYKSYDVDIDDASEYLNYSDVIQWQCLLCRYNIIRTHQCRDGLDEGWIRSNDCEQFRHIESAISPEDFAIYMDYIIEEGQAMKEDETDYAEIIHWNTDQLLSIVAESLGYINFVKMYRGLNNHYLDIPF